MAQTLGFRCVACDWNGAVCKWRYLCPSCENNLEIVYEMFNPVDFEQRGVSNLSDCTGIWRYASALPADRKWASGFRIGTTPLYQSTQPGFATNVFIKDESGNPSASFKDRATEIAVAYTRQHNMGPIVAASTGNAAASLACIGARVDHPVVIFVPERVPDGKLAQIIAHGARVIKVKGTYDDALFLSRRVSEEMGWMCRNTGYNSLTREGKKTCAFEIWEQLGNTVPDWVVIPVGDGNIISGIWKGFRELFEHGLSTRLPRLIAVQAEGSNAIFRSWRQAQKTARIGAVDVRA